MALVPQRRSRPTVSIVPLIDIMVMVLIFFIITMVPREDRNVVRLVLAQSGEAETVESQGLWVTVSLDAEGQAYVNGEPLEGEAFVARMSELQQQHSDALKLALEFDRNARNQQMINVAGWLRQAGVDLGQAGVEVNRN